MAGKGGKGLLAGKTTAAAANKDKDKKRPISRSSRAGLQVILWISTYGLLLRVYQFFFSISIVAFEDLLNKL